MIATMIATHRRLAVAALLLAAIPLGCNRSSKEPAAAHDGSHWNYVGATGPARWGHLNPDWAPCADGTSQSPIDIDPTLLADRPAPGTPLQPAELRIVHRGHVTGEINNGHTIQVNEAGGDTLFLGDEAYTLQQFHFHAPSEHTVGKKGFAMEMHLVHQSAEGKLAVLGVFIEEGAPNAAFDPIWKHLPKEQGVEERLENVTLDVERLLPTDWSSYRYEGSLTTPPCSEGVAWIVMANPIQLSARQLETFRNLVYLNNRPIQPLNGRTVVADRIVTPVAAASR